MLDEDRAGPLPAPMWLPFALLGSVAAFFSVLGVAVVLKDARFTLPDPAVLAGAGVGGLAGVVLRRWRRLHDPWLPPERQRALVALVVAVAGALIGGILVWCSERRWPEAAGGALSGAICSAFFVPGAVFMVQAAARATRARGGSIVAGSDRRSMWSTTLAVLAVAPVVSMPATAVGLISSTLGPILQPALVIGATALALAGLAILESLEVLARVRLGQVIEDVAGLEVARESDARGARELDFGLGDGAFSKLRFRDAYRGARDAEVALRGDPDEAREAIDDACGRRRRTRTLGIVAFVAALPAITALAIRVEAHGTLDTDGDPSGVAGIYDLALQDR